MPRLWSMWAVSSISRSDRPSRSIFQTELVLRSQVGEGGLEHRALGAGAPGLFLLEDLLAPDPLQGVPLQVQVLSSVETRA
jgi:hypothetical protein